MFCNNKFVDVFKVKEPLCVATDTGGDAIGDTFNDSASFEEMMLISAALSK